MPRRRGAGDEPGPDAGRRGEGVPRLPAVDGADAARPGGRTGDDPGNPLQPLPNRALADPAEPSKRHRPAYPAETVAALVDYTDRLTGGGGPDIPHLEEGDMAEGGNLFRLQCAACHAWAGDGGALLHVDAPSLRASTPTQVAEAIRLGPGQMPAFGVAALTDEQVSSVVAYIRHLNQARDVGGRPLWHLGPVAEGGSPSWPSPASCSSCAGSASAGERPARPHDHGPGGHRRDGHRRAPGRAAGGDVVPRVGGGRGRPRHRLHDGREPAAGGHLPGSLPGRPGRRLRDVGQPPHAPGPFVDARHDPEASEAELDELEADVERGGILTRRKLILRSLGLAAGGLGVAALFPIRSLGPSPGRALLETPWRDGVRVVTDDGRPVLAADVPLEGLVTVFPEGHPGSADGQAVLVRVGPACFTPLPGREDWAPDGLVAYSKVCTHAGCPVGLYQADSHELLCPCHQSSFDVLDDAEPVFGPAAAPLPQLPLRIDGEGYLVAQRRLLRAGRPRLLAAHVTALGRRGAGSWRSPGSPAGAASPCPPAAAARPRSSTTTAPRPATWPACGG